MDVYHKVLVKLLDATGGKETEVVDLKELVKKEGFLPSYEQIKSQLSRESWIAETQRQDAVKITHWGVKEARTAKGGGDSADQSVKKATTRLLADGRELLVFLEELAGDASKDNVAKAEKKLAELSSALQGLKSGV